MRCVSYTRSKPWRDLEEPLSVENQEMLIQNYVNERKGLSLRKKYSDASDDNSAFKKLMKDCLKWKFECLIIAGFPYLGDVASAFVACIEHSAIMERRTVGLARWRHWRTGMKTAASRASGAS